MMQPEGQNFKLLGFVDAGQYCDDLNFLKTGRFKSHNVPLRNFIGNVEVLFEYPIIN